MPFEPSIVARIAQHAVERPQAPAFSFLTDEHTQVTLSYAELDARARAIATTLQNQGLSGEPVLVVCPPGLDYVSSLVGAWYAGAIAVPAYPPAASGVTRMAERITAIARDARAEAALLTSGVEASAIDVRQHVLVDRIAGLGGELDCSPGQATSDPCLYQYTSGSTGTPKGVVITHANLVRYQALKQQLARFTLDDVFLCWLPPYHDMGLIGGIVTPLYVGAHGILMAPDAFIRRPWRWLQAIGRHRASVGMVPNFALELCVARVPEARREGLDLSSMRALFCGAEPIRPESVEAFMAAFEPHGFNRRALWPAYGLAEATLMVTGSVREQGPAIRSFDAEALGRGEARAVPAGPNTVRLVGCGRPTPGTSLRIVDPHSARELGPDRVGEVWVANAAVAEGYLRRPEETRHTFEATLAGADAGADIDAAPGARPGAFLRTGDLGFVADGELFIAGRIKDVIIIRGRNHYPTDLERTVQSVDAALIASAGVAFSVDDAGAERLVIVQELDHRLGRDPAELLPRIAQALAEVHQLLAKDIVLVKKGSLSKTSSGKLQRRATRQAYLEQSLRVAERARAAVSGAPRAAAPQPAGASEAAPQAPGLPPAELERLAEWLRQRLASACGVAPEAIEPDVPLTRYGIDSLSATQLADELSERVGRELPSTLVYDHPTLSRIVAALSGRPAPAPAPPSEKRAPSALEQDPIAIVGMACRVPGANDLSGFWQLLLNAVDAVTEVPPERWDNAALYDADPGVPGKIASRWGGFVEDIDGFDHAFFGIARREAERMDPQQRLFLETAWAALEDAGIAPTALSGTDAGVFVGASTRDYALLYRGALQQVDADYGPGNAAAVIANRLSYVLGATGPSMTFDTACSSALVALQAACRSLAHGDSELCVVGGVNAILTPEASVFFSKARALAADGRCKAFDAKADGFVRGEGCGVIVLKRLSQARADGDRIYALVAGSAVGHSGVSNGLLAPSGAAQERLLERALQQARIGAAELDYVEAHGVGAPLADVVEARALGSVMRRAGRAEPCVVGSVKTNIGHLEAASGIVSLIKAALALHHEQIPPSLHLNDLHPDIERERAPLEFSTVPRTFRRGERPRYVGVSAFGFGGCNAHVVLAEPPLYSGRPRLELVDAEGPPRLFTLSARSPEALRRLVRRYAQGLPQADLGDICFTLATGRAHFEHRLALVVRDHDALRARLRELLDAPELGASRPAGSTRVAALFAPPAAPEVGADPQRAVQHLQALERRFTRLGACGLEPTLVWGVGVSEYAALCAAGVLEWDAARELLALRAEVLRSLVPGALVTRTVKDFKQALSELTLSPLHCKLVSGMLERSFAAGTRLGTEHLRVHLYDESGADDGRELVASAAPDVWIELGPDTTDEQLLSALAECYGHGVELSFAPLYAAEPRRKLSLPTYAFERTRCWLPFAEPSAPEPVRSSPPAKTRLGSHPLLQRAREITVARSGFLRKATEEGTG